MLAAGTAFLAVGQTNWRFAIALTGIISAVYGVYFYFNVQDTPPGTVYQQPAKNGGMEVTSAKSFWALIASSFPLFCAMGLIAWRLSLVKFLSTSTMYVIWVGLLGFVFAAVLQNLGC